MKLNFKRIISKGNFIPEIDGLRFIAVTSVFLFHLNGFLLVNDSNKYDVDYNFDFIHYLLSIVCWVLGCSSIFRDKWFYLSKTFCSNVSY